MAKPMTANQIVEQLKKFSIPYEEYKSWRIHNRNHKGPWGPDVYGVQVHHTGSDKADQRGILYTGYTGLPGPLCHFGVDQKGKVHLIGWGRVNHAGGGDPTVLNRVIREDYSGILKPKYGEGIPGAVDGNRFFYGIEVWYSGSKPMSIAQYITVLQLATAICDFHGWSAKSVIAHGEWSNQKWDPGIKSGTMYDMNKVRSDIAATMKKGREPEVSNINDEVWNQDIHPAPSKSPTIKTNPKWKAINFLREIYDLVRETRDIVKEIRDRNG